MPTQVLVDSYLPHGVPPSVFDDSTALLAAIADVSTPGNANYGAKIQFLPRKYLATKTALLPSNVMLEGVPNETHLNRYNPSIGPIFQITGAPGAFVRGVTLNGLVLDGANSPNDLFDVAYAEYLKIRTCYFTNTAGRFLKLLSLFDSKIEDCDFSGGGSATAPVVEIGSTDNNVSNTIRFVGDRFEGFNGTALLIDGAGLNTNGIHITDGTKFESNRWNGPYIDARAMSGLVIPDAQFYFAGGTADCVIRMSNNACGLLGSFTLGAARGANLKHFIEFDQTSGGSAFTVFVNDVAGSATIPSISDVVSIQGANAWVKASIVARTFGAGFSGN